MLEDAQEDDSGNGSRRPSSPSSAVRGRIVVAAVAAGAFAAAGQSVIADEEQNDGGPREYTPLASGQDAAASFGSAASNSGSGTATDSGTTRTGKGGAPPAPEVLPVANTSDTDSEMAKLAKSQRIAQQRAEAAAARRAAIREAQKPDYVVPATGRFTSGYGGRWGSTHYGIDIANDKGTPINSVAKGEVIEAGSASGFGMWVRVEHEDGTITVYGHVNSITVEEGEQVDAGDQIATMGNRGFSTGTHLHFEVWNPSGKKINPLPWLNENGVEVPGAG
ncbi:murein DD-endopeptidase MepM/ murein hydrolase activator NlpD [Saccharopolyspora lacisalsi]|uniref:Murein DD-endopeptidase MepM/ murein hydrolase activator NlpD n=1 Tax=Halosaccharopolyspora lacisalsi TaxID=1000566 RepID=A0A839DMJ1_9PSEU|nr:M23 family metallopeptidase [Halosaccharopolyspora lacisalsi]MBA8822724.1 murein DD-endopeptidase MepM/ murein hydrolase activator NlpD [Halosaccharopolyspora lacisalsi]